jgi:ABC-type branched-subunit amino acid transport system substrate-binding protein
MMLTSLMLLTSLGRDLKLCLVIPFDGSYPQVQLGALQAVEDINSGSVSLVQNLSIDSGTTQLDIADFITDLNVVVEVVVQGSVLETYDRAENCTNNGAQAIIGPAYSSRAKVLSQYLNRRRHLPLVSFTATSPALSDADTFPYFTRTVAADDAVAFAAIDFVVEVGWEKVAFLFSEDIFGQGLHTACREYKNVHAPDLSWLSVPFSADPEQAAKIETSLRVIRDSDTLVVFFGGTSNTLPVIIETAVKLGIIGKSSGYTWVG